METKCRSFSFHSLRCNRLASACPDCSLLALWRDDNWEISTCMIVTLVLLALLGWCPLLFVIFVWIDLYVGIAFTFTFFVGAFGVVMIRQWHMNNNWLPRSYRRLANLVMVVTASASFAVGIIMSQTDPSALIFFTSLDFRR